MNSSKEILNRLLKLYPVKTLKESFNSKYQKMDDIVNEIIEQKSKTEIYNFGLEYFNLTKQHIYFFSHNINLDTLPDNILNDTDCFKRTSEGKSVSYFYFYTTSYNVITDVDNPKREEIQFEVPLRIVFEKNFVRFEFTIIEKNINSYINSSNNVINRGKTINEEDIIEKTKINLSEFGDLKILDLHKGIKFLWKENTIDALRVKYKKAKSTSIETMDEDYLLKNTYPELYDLIDNAPLEKTVFKLLKDEEKYYKHFTIDPQEGILILTVYSEGLENKENVIKKIIENN